MDNIPYGYCHCGCGRKTRIATKTDHATNRIMGQPMRYVHGHNGRRGRLKGRQLPVLHTVEDRGYTSACWIWQRYKNPGGYGKTNKYLAHRAYYEEARGPIPEGLEPDHLCRVRACVNPDHLEPVTRTENARRGARPTITFAQAREARRLRAEEGLAYRKIAEITGVPAYITADIMRGRSWR